MIAARWFGPAPPGLERRSDLRSSVQEILAVFTRLGLTAFGGPTAHPGILRDEFVRRRGWLSDEDYADLLALTRFLPGFLLVLAALPAWERLPPQARVRAALAGVNAAVAGALAAVLYKPVGISSLLGAADLGLALPAFAALGVWHWPARRVVLLAASHGVLLSLVPGP